MPTTTLLARSGPATSAGPILSAALLLTGTTFVAEALASLAVDSHVGYHSLNVLVNAGLLAASLRLALAGRGAMGIAGLVGGWATATMALLAAGGGIWAVLVEGFTSAEAPGGVEGVSHTAVLASFLFLVPLGLGLRRLDRVSGLVIAASSACLVAMVLAGLDQPEWFLAPEVALGLGFLLLYRALAQEHDR